MDRLRESTAKERSIIKNLQGKYKGRGQGLAIRFLPEILVITTAVVAELWGHYPVWNFEVNSHIVAVSFVTTYYKVVLTRTTCPLLGVASSFKSA